MNKELKVMEQKQYDDEIDLYELIDLLIKHRIIIITTTFIVVLLSIFGAYYENKRSSKVTTFYVKEYFINRDSLKTNILDNNGNVIETTKGIIEPNKVFFKNDKINSMFEVEEIKQKYRGEDNYNQKRDFLNKIFLLDEKEVGGNNKNNNEFKNKNTVLKVKISTDLNERNLEKLYSKYEENLEESIVSVDLNQKKEVYPITDIYIEKIQGKSKAKMILAVGIVMGLFLGIMVAFLKEFIDGYKKRYKK